MKYTVQYDFDELGGEYDSPRVALETDSLREARRKMAELQIQGAYGGYIVRASDKAICAYVGCGFEPPERAE